MAYIFDPNTDVGMHRSKDVIEYLRKTYGA